MVDGPIVGDEAREDTSVPWPHAATLVLHAETSRQQLWTVNSAINLVRGLAEESTKVVLADLHTGASPLATALRLEEGPGIVDVLFRADSFSNVARHPEGESFFFLNVGVDPPPIQVICGHPQWQKLAARLPEAGAHLLPCLPAFAWSEGGPIPGFEHCIVLNGAGSEVMLPPGARRIVEYVAPPEVRSHYSPSAAAPAPAPARVFLADAPSEKAAAAAAAAGNAEPVLDGVGELAEKSTGVVPTVPDEEMETARLEAPFSDRRSDAMEATWGRGSGSDLDDRTASTHDGDWKFGAGRVAAAGVGASSKRFAWAVGVAGVAVAVLALTVWRAIDSGQAPRDSGGMEAAAEADGPAVADAAAAVHAGEVEDPPGEKALAYSVVIASFSSFDDALARQRQWTTPATPFYVAPTVVRGVVYYRVFAAMLPDREAANELMLRLVDEGIKDSAADWDVRPTQLAFHFGRYHSERGAEAAVETLVAKGIPAYMVLAAAAPGSIAVHVYAGGYEDPREAIPLREQIEGAGLEAELVERVGLVAP